MLTKNDKSLIGTIVADALKTAGIGPIVQSNVTPTKEDGPNITEQSDDKTDAFDETEAKLIKQLATPNIVIYKGQRGSWKVNETQESLNALLDYRKERKAFRTGTRMK